MSVADVFANNHKVLVGYLPAGFPSKQTAIDAATAMVSNGAGIIEIGLPYSDPVLDGPVIADAVHQALVNGTRIKDVFDTVEAVAATKTPTVVMTYWNPVEQYGIANFARDLAAAGGAGLITPDLAPEEAHDWLKAADEHDLDRVFLVAPSTTDERIKTITSHCRGFVYAVSLMGITGTRTAVSKDAEGLVARIKQHTTLPVAVGLGVSTGEQAAEVAAFKGVDGVIVGSAFVRRLFNETDPARAVDQIGRLTAELAGGVRHSTR
jgi:tryptophan synthase alpha chain